MWETLLSPTSPLTYSNSHTSLQTISSSSYHSQVRDLPQQELANLQIVQALFDDLEKDLGFEAYTGGKNTGDLFAIVEEGKRRATMNKAPVPISPAPMSPSVNIVSGTVPDFAMAPIVPDSPLSSLKNTP